MSWLRSGRHPTSRPSRIWPFRAILCTGLSGAAGRVASPSDPKHAAHLGDRSDRSVLPKLADTFCGPRPGTEVHPPVFRQVCAREQRVCMRCWRSETWGHASVSLGRWISVKFSKSSPRAVTAVSSAMNSAVALQASNRDLTASTPEQARIRASLTSSRNSSSCSSEREDEGPSAEISGAAFVARAAQRAFQHDETTSIVPDVRQAFKLNVGQEGQGVAAGRTQQRCAALGGFHDFLPRRTCRV